ncbi:MAG: helix-turn-helix domain-containing protein [Caulobacteraceae bacterium]
MTGETELDSRLVDMDAWLQDPSTSRVVNAFAVEFAVRYMREAAHLFDNDYETAMIFLAVLEANGRQNIRAAWFRGDYADVHKALPPELARPISRQAIAQSLGLSRETVRRKIAALIKQGFLVADERGGVITARGAIATEAFLAAQKRVIGYVRQFRADLLRHAGAPSA